MTHPTDTEWVSFIYGEIPPQETARLEAHLRDCPVCRSQVQEWRQTGKALDSWKLSGAKPVLAKFPQWKWAAAAALILGIGFGAGRFSGRAQTEASISQKLRGEMQISLALAREELARELDRRVETASAKTLAQSVSETRHLVAEVKTTAARDRGEDRAVLLSALQSLEEKRAAEFKSLRKELETVAVLTEESLQRAQSQLVRLAGYTPENADGSP